MVKTDGITRESPMVCVQLPNPDGLTRLSPRVLIKLYYNKDLEFLKHHTAEFMSENGLNGNHLFRKKKTVKDYTPPKKRKEKKLRIA